LLLAERQQAIVRLLGGHEMQVRRAADHVAHRVVDRPQGPVATGQVRDRKQQVHRDNSRGQLFATVPEHQQPIRTLHLEGRRHAADGVPERHSHVARRVAVGRGRRLDRDGKAGGAHLLHRLAEARVEMHPGHQQGGLEIRVCR
jgi:hypothetical protein